MRSGWRDGAGTGHGGTADMGMRLWNAGESSPGGSRQTRPQRRSRSAFTLVEVIVAVLIMVVAIAGISSSMLSSMALNRVNDETALAHEAARAELERLSGVPFDQIWATYNADPSDDGGLPLPVPGSGFAVAGLDPRTGDADGLCGRIEFPSMDVGAGQELREDVVDPQLGMPRDLDGDGVWPEASAIVDYAVLPVRVLVEWRGVSGDRQIRLETMLCAR